MSDSYSTDMEITKEMSIDLMYSVLDVIVEFTDVRFPSCWTSGFPSWSRWCLKWPAHFNLSLPVLFIPLLCLSSLFLSGPSTPPFISPTFISHHLIPASMLLSPSTLFPHTFAFVSTISPSLLLCLHVFCLVMAFVKGILDQLLTAPAAEPDTSSHPTLIRSLPSSYTLVKVSY